MRGLRTTPFTKTRGPRLDHHHASGLVRGFLCNRCNTLLGYLHDDMDLLYGLAEYLRDPPAPEVIGKVYAKRSAGEAGRINPCRHGNVGECAYCKEHP